MFNLENKITWKELAPSLQAMFKTLQSQITDVKNEVNNINISLGDINDHLTQIDKDITNINENMTTIIRDTVEDMAGKMMFLNLAPKIGYYQEDKIEVISKYNMNYPFSDYFSNCTTNYAICADRLNREIIMVTAYDGSINIHERLFYGYRTSTSSIFTWINTPIDTPKCLKDEGYNENRIKYKIIRNLEDDYLIIECSTSTGNYGPSDTTTNHTFIFMTNQTPDSSEWTEYKDISSIFPAFRQGPEYIRYFPSYKVFLKLFINNFSQNGRNAASIVIYDYDTLSLKRRTDFKFYYEVISGVPTDEGDIYHGNDLYVYFVAGNRSKTMITDTTSNFTFGFIPQELGCLIYEKQNLMILFSFRQLLIGYRMRDNSRVSHNSWSFKGDYQISSVDDLLKGNEVTITLLTPATFFNRYNSKYSDLKTFDKMFFVNDYFPGYITTYSKLFNRYYLCGQTYNNVGGRNIVYVDADTDQYPKPYARDTFGVQGFNQITFYQFGVPDASTYGKGLFAYYSVFDRLFIMGISKGTDTDNNGINWNYIEVDKFKWTDFYTDDNKAIEPSPGKSLSFNGISFYDEWESRRVSQCKESDGTIHYYINAITSDNRQIQTREYLLNNPDTSKMRVTYGDIIMTTDYSAVATYLENNNLTRKEVENVLGNKRYTILFLLDNNKAGSNTTYYPAIIDRSSPSAINVFKDSSIYCSNYNSMLSYARDAYNSGLTASFKVSGAVEYKVNSWWFITEIYKSDNGYKEFIFIINISNNGKTITMENGSCSHIPYSYTGYNIRPITATLTNKYGGCAQGNGWTYRPQRICTQKPLIGTKSWEKTYTDDEFWKQGKANIYYMYLQSSQGLVAYIPSIPIFLGGYFSIIENPIPVTLKPNSDNYIYIERDSNDRTNIIASSSTTRTINEGDKVFNKILCAKVTTDSANMTAVEYYRINTGYNDYSFA